MLMDGVAGCYQRPVQFDPVTHAQRTYDRFGQRQRQSAGS
jgi:hypothetical protein